MSAKKNVDLCREYRLKYPDYPNLKLARIIYKKHPLKFKDLERVRGTLRYISGNSGSGDRKKVADSPFLESPRPLNPYNLPDSDETKYEPFRIIGHKKVGILSDVHIPYHNLPALTAAIKYLKKEKVDAVLLNGDTIDCHHLSRFEKDAEKRKFSEEIKLLNQFFDSLEKTLKCKIYFKIGNHEARYESYLRQKAGEIADIEDFQFAKLIRAEQMGISIIESNQYMKLNKLNGIHGHEFKTGISVPVNIARGLYMKGKVSAFQGHNHATSEHTEPDMNSEITTTWSIGCLCELHPAYMPLNKWNHGFALVELDPNGRDYRFHNKRIYNGLVL